MQMIIKGMGLFCSFGIVILLGVEDMSNTVKLPIVALFMLIILYCLRRRQPEETKSEKA